MPITDHTYQIVVFSKCKGFLERTTKI